MYETCVLMLCFQLSPWNQAFVLTVISPAAGLCSTWFAMSVKKSASGLPEFRFIFTLSTVTNIDIYFIILFMIIGPLTLFSATKGKSVFIIIIRASPLSKTTEFQLTAKTISKNYHSVLKNFIAFSDGLKYFLSFIWGFSISKEQNNLLYMKHKSFKIFKIIFCIQYKF